MLQRRPKTWIWLTLAAAACTLLPLRADDPQAGPEAARLDQYATADGQSYFALTLQPSIPGGEAGPHDIVVLFDTSASQAGDFRTRSFEALEALLGALDAEDRVHLIACDVSSVAMSPAFVAPQGAEIKQAVQKLQGRAPLGATDMVAALDMASAALDMASAALGDSRAPHRAVIYIGDGVSSAGVVDKATAERLVTSFVKNQTPVSAYGIGPSVDGALLAALVNQTGGALVIYGDEVTTLQAGRFLAAAARETVAWPETVEWPAGVTEVFPATLPPLRGDRETVVIGTGHVPAEAVVKVHAQQGGQGRDFAWKIDAQPAHDDNADLVTLVEGARGDAGLSLPTLGSEGLRRTRRLVAAAADQLSKLGQNAAATGKPAEAQRLAQAAMKLDPANQLAQAVHRRAAQDEKTLRLVANRQQPADGGVVPLEGGDGDLLSDFEQQQRVLAERTEAEVVDAINTARRLMGVNPEGATSELKLIRERVLEAPELDAAKRTQLLGQLDAALRDAAVQRVEVEHRSVQAAERASAAAEETRILNELYLRDEKIEQLTARYVSLMAEDRYAEAEEVAMATREMQPYGTVPTAGILTARTAGYLSLAMNLREQRHRGVVSMLESVERSHIPISDEPPILYPDPEVWQSLTERRKQYKQVDLAQSGPAELRINAALDEQTDLDFEDTPLSEVLQYLQERHKIPIQQDKKAMEDAGIASDTPVTWVLKGVKLKSALKLILREHELTYFIENEVLMITTKEKADASLKTKVYPVGDLVLPIPRIQTGSLGSVGGGGFGGAGGGQQGGGGFGGGGGGFGGGGGGFGGGGQGGGFFNVPRRFRPFAVKDKLNLKKGESKPAKNAPAAVAPEAPADELPAPRPAKARKPQVIQVQIAPQQTAEAAYAEYFSTHRTPPVEPADVRETVRKLVEQKKYDASIGLMQAALRHGQGQPWMYEALGISMQLAGSEPAEIERALLSAVDFSRSHTDTLYVAYYLAKSGFDRRALALFQSVSRAEPGRPEPYLHGLGAASRLNDTAGLKWATVGILNQAWTDDQTLIWETARRKALAVIDQLRSDGKETEAAEFQAAYDEAMRRDLVVVVKWVGEADVDLSVEEPSGAVCSLRSPRSLGGGVLVNDVAKVGDGPQQAMSSEMYVCPQGFNGTYRISVRRVWGKIPSGKVTVEILANYGSPEQVAYRKQVPVEERDSIVAFDLENGRRREALEAEQLAVAAADQAAVGRDVLFRQLNAAASSSALRNLAIARNEVDLARQIFGRRGAVGYMPVITILPEGANMQVQQAVISADRRYVRMTPLPFFSSITKVDTFTFSGGGGGQNGQNGQNGNNGGNNGNNNGFP